VTGQKWQWFFTYPNGYVTGELHVPVDRPVELTMTSEDVIHSLWIPAFRVKKDVVPGRYNKAWFEATEPGEYPLLCTEYCGTGHSDMLTRVTVHRPGEFETWLREAADLLGTLPPAEAGLKLYETKGCKQCHSLDGSAGVGPSFKNLFGSERHLADGGQVVADENYVRHSILEPMSQVSLGFDPVMPTYAGKLKDQEITMLIAYLKSISANVSTEEADDAEAATQADPAQDDAQPADEAAGQEGE
jgi:cytochrome c oxidase subunit 2